MKDVVIAGYLRTPFSRSKPGKPEVDVFHTLRADELLSMIMPVILERIKVSPEEVNDFIIGSALGVNEQWTYGGRTPLFLANLSEKTSAKFIDQQCGSSMAALHMGYLEIATGYADIVIVAGMEHMTRVPIGPSLYESGRADINSKLFSEPEYAHWDMQTTMNMGITAEKLCKTSGIDRQACDKWSVRSHLRATAARERGFFADEILAVNALQADGKMLTVEHDQCVRPSANMQSQAGLRPAFRENGVITAGNASPLNAGASCMVLMSREAAQTRGLNADLAVRSIGFTGVDPTNMGVAPVPAAKMALEKIGLKSTSVDYWEINEAFAVVTLHMIKEMGISPECVNVNGGALAIGHAMGATGVRLVGTLSRVLKEQNGHFGCAAACVGGGQGVAAIVEHLKSPVT